MHSYEQASAYIAALTYGCPDDVIDFRFISDTNKSVPAIKRRGRLNDIWQEACNWNAQGYGIFCCINAMDGVGNELANVSYIRTHAVDLDNLSAQQNLERAAAWSPAPSFAVQSSAGKYHCYFRMVPYQSNDFYTLHQRKLRQLFDGDGSIIDPTRVMRVPGFFHMKQPASPHLVTCWALGGYGQLIPAETLQAALANVNVTDGQGGRHELGDDTLSAPSLDWCKYALATTDPNGMNRAEWISYSAAWKQSAWRFADNDTLFAIWSEWCARYSGNDLGENLKQWNSIRNTEVGWTYLTHKNPGLKAFLNFGGKEHKLSEEQLKQTIDAPKPQSAPAPAPMPEPPPLDCSGEILTDMEQREWFKGCIFVERFGEILSPSGRMMNATKFNGTYGGKQFIITSTAKCTDEAWKAATRSTLWTVPKVDHIRFLPHVKPGDTVTDELGRKGVNVYKPAIITSMPGDVTPFLHNMQMMLPIESDRHTLFAYLAHNARFPGHKIPWAPLIQSVEGVGKGVLKRIIRHVMGGPYVHFPNAQELIESGSKFNAWMRNKLFILVDEIKVDERRDMIEVLKPMISETEIEIQGKGQDQDKEDNYSNWAFFSNHKDAIPINANARRFAIFYSAIQSKADLVARGMDDAYFNRLYDWLDGPGAAMVAHWLLNYPIERGGLPMRAPDTSSTIEAQLVSRSGHEQAIIDAVKDQIQGFRGGWVGSTAAAKRFKALGLRVPGASALRSILDRLGYHHIARSERAWHLEGLEERSELYHLLPDVFPGAYGRAQGYE